MWSGSITGSTCLIIASWGETEKGMGMGWMVKLLFPSETSDAFLRTLSNHVISHHIVLNECIDVHDRSIKARPWQAEWEGAQKKPFTANETGHGTELDRCKGT
ncbi:uncharacterized protein B0T23DRAFT_397923 [Neurospora hispaniola]|uniref:Uncharacterized protein n=1 Tax=Neurospora hispaniola TaxID=588809 RepID=A0AAJ0I4G0_9PEZI|nr:hypothetical protein B0T23DRAFT_397923 [Neurospora hispaniola]